MYECVKLCKSKWNLHWSIFLKSKQKNWNTELTFSKQFPKDLIIDTDHTVVMWYRSYRGHIFFRWLFLKDSFLAYVRPRDGIICDVMLMDKDFCVENGFGLTGAKHGLQIVNLNRSVDDSTRILPLNRSLIFNTCMKKSSFWNFMTTLVWIISCTQAYRTVKLGL